MIDHVLAFAIYLLAGVSVVSAVVLVQAAWEKPRIGALTERAVIALALALFLVAYALAIFNNETGHAVVPVEFVRTALRAVAIVLALVPAYWSLLYLTGRLR